ncbi:11945_t:CDS:2 [Ambispora gerdemannii]|uniref:11945_t:CDS:1 n=1 Tax=Ambispora gerdemannii TaxID=144530 RepID=A0A9N9B8F5_9GLOM|nr:11945_t:CDS:2 [Ambispora gerdemannii]
MSQKLSSTCYSTSSVSKTNLLSSLSSPSRSTKKRSIEIQAPTVLTCLTPKTCQLITIEYSIHACSSRLSRELEKVFPEVAADLGRCLVVPTFQKCEHDLVGVGPLVDKERDAKLEAFIEWGTSICEKLRQYGHWADITDPASGFPVFSSPGPSMYPDVEGAQQLLKYDVQNAGCCHILLHPQWGSKNYPATLFTTADADTLKNVISDCFRTESSKESY